MPHVSGVSTVFHRFSVTCAPFCPLLSPVDGPPWGSLCRHLGGAQLSARPRSYSLFLLADTVVSIAAANVLLSWREVAGSVSTWVSLFSLGEPFIRYSHEALSEACSQSLRRVRLCRLLLQGILPTQGLNLCPLVSLHPLPWQAGSSHHAPWEASGACSSVVRLRGECPRAQHRDHEASSQDDQGPLVCVRPQNRCPDRRQLWGFCKRGRVVRCLGCRLALSTALSGSGLWALRLALFVVESRSMVRTEPSLVVPSPAKGCGLVSRLDPWEEGCFAHATPVF